MYDGKRRPYADSVPERTRLQARLFRSAARGHQRRPGAADRTDSSSHTGGIDRTCAGNHAGDVFFIGPSHPTGDDHAERTASRRACPAGYAAQIETQQTIDSLRGIEGIIAREYFAALVKVFEGLDLNFSGRVRRPPTDPVNAVLSYTYILLTEHCACALQTTRFDIYLGFMHKPNRNAPALALDFVEQFRQPIADRFVMLLFNKKILQAADFNPGPMHSVLLTESAKRTLITQWEQFLETPQRLLENQPHLSPRDLLYRQAEAFEAAIRDKKSYTHYRLCL
ncbi:MAG TPA: CRISPR-associated endonuclease Cas1 [Phycisphaerales bacterium]|nr:CRISPR-associated endonuclease Cas1 [Phycisphaerales bacterium]